MEKEILYKKLQEEILVKEDFKEIFDLSESKDIFNLLFLMPKLDLENTRITKKFNCAFWENFYGTIRTLMAKYQLVNESKRSAELRSIKNSIIKELCGLIDSKKICEISLLFKNFDNLMGKEMCDKDQSEIIDIIVFEIKNIAYLKQVLYKYPKLANIKDSTIIIKIVKYLCGNLKYNERVEESLFYSNVLRELFVNKYFDISVEQLKLCYLRIKEIIQEIPTTDQKYGQKLSICESMLNLFDEKKLSYKNMKYIFNKYDMKRNFTKNVKTEVKRIIENPDIIAAKKNIGNCVVTIDKTKTCDRDDAFSINRFPDYYEIKVYISDVAKFIPIDSLIDKEAYRRTTTIYLPDKTINMLEQRLSNRILSLNQNEYRRVIEYSFKVYLDGSIVDFKIKPNIIKVDYCLSYNEANSIINRGNDDELSRTLENLNEACLLIRKNNPQKNLYTELEYLLKCINNDHVFEKLNGTISSQVMIMELMATIGHLTPMLFSNKNYPFLYRNLLPFYLTEDYKEIRNLESKDINKYGNTEQIISILKKLCPTPYFSLNNEGHYGLCYTHYAYVGSPIRRYSDLTNERLIYDYIFSKPSLEKDHYWIKKIEQVAQQLNEQATIINEFYKEYTLVKSL